MLHPPHPPPPPFIEFCPSSLTSEQASSWVWSVLLKVMLTVGIERGDCMSPSLPALRFTVPACQGIQSDGFPVYSLVPRPVPLRWLYKMLLSALWEQEWWILFDWCDEGFPAASSSLSHHSMISTYDKQEEMTLRVMKVTKLLCKQESSSAGLNLLPKTFSIVTLLS